MSVTRLPAASLGTPHLGLENLVTYHKLNSELKDLQLYHIVDHEVLVVERTPEEKELKADYALLEAEILMLLDTQISKAADDAVDSLANNPADYGRKIKVVVDAEALYTQFAGILNKYIDLINSTADENGVTSLKAGVLAIANKYATEYPGADENSVVVNFSEIVYESVYSFKTDSCGDSDNYDKTEYTIDNGNVVKVTYKLGDKVTYFILNYNLYAVDVMLSDGTSVHLEAYSHYRSN